MGIYIFKYIIYRLLDCGRAINSLVVVFLLLPLPLAVIIVFTYFIKVFNWIVRYELSMDSLCVVHRNKMTDKNVYYF